MSILYIMMGAPGSGKSTFIKNHIDKNAVCISRDEVRFSMVAEGEEYFSKEKQVFKEYIKRINDALESGYNVFADATHLNKASRNKLLRAINPKLNIKIDVIWIKTPLDICIERNSLREGTRSYVPETAIRNMYNSIQAPEFEEGINKIYIVEPNQPIVIKEEI